MKHDNPQLPATCPTCKGEGVIDEYMEFEEDSHRLKDCPTCHGTGLVSSTPASEAKCICTPKVAVAIRGHIRECPLNQYNQPTPDEQPKPYSTSVQNGYPQGEQPRPFYAHIVGSEVVVSTPAQPSAVDSVEAAITRIRTAFQLESEPLKLWQRERITAAIEALLSQREAKARREELEAAQAVAIANNFTGKEFENHIASRIAEIGEELR